MRRTKEKTCAALFLSVLAAASFILLMAFTVHEAGHICTGRDCAICEIITAGSKTLKELLVPKAEPAVVKGTVYVPVLRADLFPQVSYRITPVQKKCRMNL